MFAELTKIKKFKNIHKGECCYLIGDGVSIKWFDLNKFSDHISFSMSLIPFHKDFNVLRSDYMLLTEPYWFYPSFWTKYISRSISMPYIQKSYREVIEKNKNKNFFVNLSNYPVLNSSNITYLFKNIYDDSLSDDFISNRINPYSSSLTAAVCLSIYMGFDKCYLIGCDYTHAPSRNLHWYEKGEGHYIEHEGYQKEFFSIAKEFIDICAVTLDGEANYIDSVTYEDYSGSRAVFKENNLILSDVYMNILNTWGDYTIYSG